MKKLIIGILFISTSVFGQEFNFDIHNTSLAAYLSLEEKLGSTRIPTTSNHVSFSGEAQPITFLREENITNTNIKIVQSQKVSSYILDWVQAINDNSVSDLEKLYASNALKVISGDSIINSSKKIAAYYEIQKHKVISIESLFKIEANHDRRITYEIIKYKTADRKAYTQLLIWRYEGQQVVREFEYTEESGSEPKNVDINEIAKRRKLWMELCNQHNAKSLVQQLYSYNTIYFNHKPIVQGVENVTKEYSYMNNSNYLLNLQPIKLEVVNTNLVYEIGQCSGSYNGKYMLVWKKQSNGNWKIYIDSNI